MSENQIGQDFFDHVTPLHVALCAGNADLVQELLRRGADARSWFEVAGHYIGQDRFSRYHYDCWQLVGSTGEDYELLAGCQHDTPSVEEWAFRAEQEQRANEMVNEGWEKEEGRPEQEQRANEMVDELWEEEEGRLAQQYFLPEQ